MSMVRINLDHIRTRAGQIEPVMPQAAELGIHYYSFHITSQDAFPRGT